MTATSFSLMSSECFVALLIWARCTAVVCLVDEKLPVQPTTTKVHHSTPMTPDHTSGQSTLPFACGNNTPKCMEICKICNDLYKAPTMDCLSLLFSHLCLNEFENSMESLSNTGWCIWGNVRGLYSNLSRCTEDVSDCLLIPWPNHLVEETFVQIHYRFFKNCSTEELSDPPSVIIFALVITPICLIPVMVSLVVLKTKNGDGSS